MMRRATGSAHLSSTNCAATPVAAVFSALSTLRASGPRRTALLLRRGMSTSGTDADAEAVRREAVKLPETISSFIDGSYRSENEGTTKNRRALVNPSTGEVVQAMVLASESDVDDVIGSTKKAQGHWATIPASERAQILHNAAEILDRRNEELAFLEAFDTGRPIQETMVVDIKSASDCLRYMAGVSRGLTGQHVHLSGPGDAGGSFCYVRREPLGVTAGIGAWNYPLQGCVWKAAPALAMGNGMVFKPSEETPLTALAFAEVLIEAGVPPGVFNVVLGEGDVGAALCSHRDVHKVSFTGSAATGRKVAEAAGLNLKKVTLEMGGKSPLIVFEDADLENAVSAAMIGNWYSCGEVCSNGTRVFVHKKMKEQFLESLLARTSLLRIGDPLDMETHIGPLVSAAHRDKVTGFVERAASDGAEVVSCDNHAEYLRGIKSSESKGHLAGGFFVSPTIITGASDDMEIAKEEVFGPVMTILEFESTDEVISRANATPYGLAAGIFTNDLRRAHRASAALDAGTVWVNNYNLTPVEVPWGGFKASGIGFENGPEAMMQWTRPKTVYIEMGDVDSPYN